MALGASIINLAITESPVSAKAANDPSGCKTTSFTGSGGYYSATRFYPESTEQVKVVTHWCFSHGFITSHWVKTTTSISKAQHLYIHKTVRLYQGGRALSVSINGNFSSDVLHNGGLISITGRVTALGLHRFADVTGSEG
jgi:hypothetical protein